MEKEKNLMYEVTLKLKKSQQGKEDGLYVSTVNGKAGKSHQHLVRFYTESIENLHEKINVNELDFFEVRVIEKPTISMAYKPPKTTATPQAENDIDCVINNDIDILTSEDYDLTRGGKGFKFD